MAKVVVALGDETSEFSVGENTTDIYKKVAMIQLILSLTSGNEHINTHTAFDRQELFISTQTKKVFDEICNYFDELEYIGGENLPFIRWRG